MYKAPINEYAELLQKVAKKYKHTKITLTVTHAQDKVTATLVQNAQNNLDQYHIIYDPKHSLTIDDITDSYYCSTIEELKQILFFILKNKKLYTTKPSHDIYELDDILSLDDLEDFQ